MELKEADEDRADGARGELHDRTSGQDMKDSDATLVAEMGMIGSSRESFALDSRNNEPSNNFTALDTFSGTRAATPLFVSSREGSSGLDIPTPVSSEPSSRQSINLPKGATFAVVAPPVRRRWEYQTLDDDPSVASVLREENEAGAISYVIESQDHRRMRVSFEQLLQLPGGPRALERFEDRETHESEESESPDSDVRMVSTRSLNSRRPRQTGFVDISQLNLSEEDELGDARSRPNRRRGLLSAPRPPPRRGSRQRGPPPVSESSTESSDSDAPKRRKGQTIRTIRATRSTAISNFKYTELPPDDESEVSSSGDSYARLGKRKRAHYHGLEGTRRSERSGRAKESMHERGEDDIPETNTRTSSKGGVKVVGAKENFVPLPRNDDFRLRHCLSCDTCKDYGDSAEKGKLVFCQGCTIAYHQACLGPRNGREHLVTKVGDKDFVLQCRRCIGFARKNEATAPRQGHCQVCHGQGSACEPFRQRKTARDEHREREENSGEDPIAVVESQLINNAENILFRCTGCYQAYHMHHLPPKTEQPGLQTDDPTQVAIERFGEYCKDWLCDDCSTAPAEIDALVAWRPVDLEAYIPGQSTEQVDEDDKEYLIKWKKMSHYRVAWKGGAWVWGMTHASMRKAFTRQNNGINLPKMNTEDAVPEDFLRVDIVFEIKYNNIVSTRTEQIDLARVREVEKARVKFKGLGYEDVVWQEPPDPEDVDRWIDWKIAYEDWVRGHYVHLPNQNNLKSHMAKIKSQKFESKIMMNEQPKSLTGGELMKYQMEGLNWLLYQWHSGQNAILADEMGLGKTIQIIGFLTTLQQVHKCWPFLVVVPNSTCANWRREIKHWAPSLRVVTYFGSTEARKLAHQFELFPDKIHKDLACHVVVTSYDAAQDIHVQAVFRRIPWAGLIVDEGQRLKNDKNLLYAALTSLKVPFRVLLTGTPLQNNQRELFNLLQFLDNSVNAQQLEEQYATLTKENVPELHELLRPFFLRRTKAQVLDFLPPMAQIIVPVTPSVLQKQLYKSILAKNPELLKSIIGGDKKAPVKGLRNLLMQLRKCLCHPFVYSIAIEERTSNTTVSHRRLVEASSKLQLLEIMLPKLKDRGHRVLIFSQFLDMITIVEDFLDGIGLLHERLDGTMGSLEKQKRIDEFNAPDSPLFALLLSTRAGGVGINLATADTVIILDPDFNPHQDIQAISRAHRIGQKKKVLIFQMMTRGTAEEKIMQIGKKKMALDHVLIEQMEADDADSNDLESVLRFGAEALFKDDSTQDIIYDSASVDKLLDRSQIEDTKTGKDDSAESQFSFARVWANETGTMEDNLGSTSDAEAHAPDPTVWGKILEERKRQAEQDSLLRAETLGRGKRQRRAVDYTKQGVNANDLLDSPGKHGKNSDNDTDFTAREESEPEESADDAEDGGDVAGELRSDGERPSRSTLLSNRPSGPKVGKFRRAQVKTDAVPRNDPRAQPACAACLDQHGPHEIGYCPLKLAGVEHCNLCGLAHFGTPGACITLRAKERFSDISEALKKSPEADATAKAARKILRKFKADLVERERMVGARGQSETARKVGRQQEQMEHLKRRKLGPMNGSESPMHGGSGSIAHKEHARELRAADAMFARNGAGMGHTGAPPGYKSPAGVNGPLYAEPYTNPRGAGVDPQAAAFAAISQAPRQFSTFNQTAPPAKK